ncbi:MAG: GNAT family N-acetyltransferase [Dehalococcoidia bacterium]
MSTTEGKVEIRPMNPEDTNTILSIDSEIRAAGKAITYENLTAEYILFATKGIRPQENPASYVGSLTGNVAALLDFSFVAEVHGQVRGFVLGQVARLRESATEVGVIEMIGVHPDYQRRGIGAKLIDTLADKYRAKGIKIMRIGINYRDKSLLGLVERTGFSATRVIVYSKIL